MPEQIGKCMNMPLNRGKCIFLQRRCDVCDGMVVRRLKDTSSFIIIAQGKTLCIGASLPSSRTEASVGHSMPTGQRLLDGDFGMLVPVSLKIYTLHIAVFDRFAEVIL